MLDVIREIGAVAGLAAFLGLAALALLYFSQAKDVRRLRENAEFLFERSEEPDAVPEVDRDDDGEPATAATTAAAAPKAAKPKKSAADAEAFRRAELARQAADRRQRFEQRRRGGGDDRPLAGATGGGRMDSLPETRSLVVIVIGVVLLLAGLAFGASRFLGDGGGDAGQKKAAPAKVEVAVLNSTATPGLAAGFADQVKSAGFTIGNVTNSSTPEVASLVEYDKDGREAAQQVGQLLEIKEIAPMSGEIRGLAEGAPVALVLGSDKESGG
ncbi:MAG: LytR family transcriptional regulator [Solirubrobacterales bacterium]|nr:LytR family transcriptional regulator [Solirubrobacterales bacterium]